MSRDGSGVYSLPAGSHGSPNTTIESAKYNNVIDDLAQDANTVRPVSSGGTGRSSLTDFKTDLAVPPAQTVSAKTSNFSVGTGEDRKVYPVDATGGAVTASLPSFSGVPYDGFEITVKKTDSSANAVTLDGSSSEKIDDALTLALASQYASVTLVCDKTNSMWRVKSRSGAVFAAYGLTYTLTEDEPVYIAQPAAKTYKIIIDRKFAGTLVEMTGKLESGTCSVQAKIAGVSVGSALSATSTESTVSYSTGNTFAAGDDIDITVASISTPVGLSLNLKYTRVLS